MFHLYIGMLPLSLYHRMRLGLSPWWWLEGVQLQGISTPSPITPTTSCLTTEMFQKINDSIAILDFFDFTFFNKLVIIHIGVICVSLRLRVEMTLVNQAQNDQEYHGLRHSLATAGVWLRWVYSIKLNFFSFSNISISNFRIYWL